MVSRDVLKGLMKQLQDEWSYFNYVVEDALREENNFGLSTAPCNPAPGRRLLIIRTDTASSHGFLNIGTTSPTLSPGDDGKVNGNGPDARSLAQRLASAIEPSESIKKKRNSLFGSVFGSTKPSSDPPSRTGSPSKDDDTNGAPSANQSEDGSREVSPERRNGSRASMYEQRPSPLDAKRPNAPARGNMPHFQAAFKFSLEFIDRRPQNLPVDMFLQPPRVPLAAQLLLQAQSDYAPNEKPLEPKGCAEEKATYMGRALAEWTLVVNECQNFFERRRNEGVPSNKQVETPSLGVESFRRPG